MRVLVVGDSWASAVEADTGKDAGWPQILGIEDEYRRGVAGSTAREWATNQDGILSDAEVMESDTVIISLLGNDAREIWSDGKVTHDEVFMALGAMRMVAERLRRERTIVMLYADPFQGKDPEYAYGLQMLNAGLRMATWPATFLDLGKVLKPEHFDGKDIHPTRKGHEVIASAVEELLV